MEVIQKLAEGSYGSVSLIRYEGETAIMKIMLDEEEIDSFLWEARLLVELDGAGGMPKLHALSLDQPTLILEYAGKSFHDFLQSGECSVGLFLDSIVCIAQQLGELHDKSVIHNDIKTNNITVSGSASNLTFRLIDCGLATRAGQPFDVESYDFDPEDTDTWPWLSPELKDGRPLLPSSDVYGLGDLLRDVSRWTRHSSLKDALQPLVTSCTHWDPEARPSLLEVVSVINDLKEGQLQSVLDSGLLDAP